MKNEFPRTRSFRPLAILLGLVMLGVVLRFTVFAPEPLAVRVQAARRGLVESTVSNSKAGTVEARRRSRIAAEIGGRVVEIAYREGAHVKAGDPLVRLADVSHVAKLELARNGVAVSEARRENACLLRDRSRRELMRVEKLAANNVASEDRLDALQYSFDSARVACKAGGAELLQSLAQQQSAEAELAKTVITAPFDGVVAEVNVEIGEWVTPSPPMLTSPPVVDLIDPTSIFVSAPMDEVDSGAVRAGLSVKVTVDSRPGEVFTGMVSRVAPYVVDEEAQNRTLEIEVALDDTAVAISLLPGTSADAEVILEARANVMRVPSSALLRDRAVLILEDGRLVKREVELGLRNWKFAEVKSGLEVGDLVVTALDRIEIEAGARAVAIGDDNRVAP